MNRKLREEIASLRELVEKLAAEKADSVPAPVQDVVQKQDVEELLKTIKGVDQALAKMNGLLTSKIDHAERQANAASADVATLLGEVSELSGHYAQQEARLRAIAQALVP